MKKIILVIFSFAIIVSLSIYLTTKKGKNNILYIGEYYNINNKNITTFMYDKVTYKELINCIRSNDYIIIKNKKIYLNQLINKSNIIILNVNNIEYKNRCKRGINNYNTFTNKYMNELLFLINKISNAKIYVINNKCNNQIINYNLAIGIKNVQFINDIKDIIN